MHKLILDNLLLINHSNMFRPLSWSHHQGVRNPWELQSHCWSDWSVINYPELICAFCWFIFVFIIENARSKKQNTSRQAYTFLQLLRCDILSSGIRRCVTGHFVPDVSTRRSGLTIKASKYPGLLKMKSLRCLNFLKTTYIWKKTQQFTQM